MKHVTFNKNLFGRDFVCGDLHGSYDLFAQALDHIEFDSSIDRMFSVGDLVDRGPNSLECLKLLDHSWFFAVKANHEQLMEDWSTGGPTGAWWFPNGGNWFNTLNTEDKATVIRMLPKVQNLPWMITVNKSLGGKFHVIHAEILGESDETITDEFLETNFIDIASRVSQDGHGLLWGRDIFRDLFAKDISDHHAQLHMSLLKKHGITDFFNDKLSHIFSGHTPMKNPTTVMGQTNLDTMAFASEKHDWAGLTIVEPSTNMFWKSTKSGVTQVLPTVL